MNLRPMLGAVILVAIFAIPALQLRAADPNMSAAERAHVVKLLQDSQKEYLFTSRM